ncbi:MAG TPA: peptidoglycan binding domain-containing protein [Candidatus Saccharimonadales bacterium]|nr:peptidoglycan binding domain-containing protein [Candidatus Saccharimonadales bacterium]
MNDNRLFRKAKALVRSRRFQVIAGGVLAVFIMFNIGMAAYYNGKTLPRTTVNGHQFGSTDFNRFDDKLKKSDILPSEIQLTYKDKKTKIRTSELGFSSDVKKIEAYSREHRSWLPVFDLLGNHEIPSFVTVNEVEFDKAFASLDQTFKQNPVNARIVLEKDDFKLVSETEGYKLKAAKTRTDLVATLTAGDNKLTLPAEPINPQVKKQKLEASLQDLQKQLKTSVIFRYQAKNYKLTTQDIAGFYIPSGDSYVLSDAQIRARIVAVGAASGSKSRTSAKR